MKKIPVTLLTGFLGSGKTTLLTQLLEDSSFNNTAVLVNEFGEVSLDHLLIAELSENIVELRDGCLCCSINGDLALTLRDLYQKRYMDEIPRFDRVIIETSGVADPIPILHTLTSTPALKPIYRVDAVVTTVDALHGKNTLANHETAANQVALADILLMTKGDLVEDSHKKVLQEELSRLTNVAVQEVCNGDIAAELLLDRDLFAPADSFERLTAWAGLDQGHRHSHAEHYGSHVIIEPRPLSLAGTSVFLNRVVNDMRDQLLRIKGLVRFQGKAEIGVVHAVQDRFYPITWLAEGAEMQRESKFVFIGRNLDTKRIDELFLSLCF